MCRWGELAYWTGFVFWVYAFWRCQQAFRRWHTAADAYLAKLIELSENEEREW